MPAGFGWACGGQSSGWELLPAWLERGRGCFVVTALAAGLLTMLGSATYSVTKHAAEGYAEWLAATYRHRGLVVHCICPQGVRTNMLAESGQAGQVVLKDAAIEPDRVADALLEGIAAGQFLILPHPEVRGYYELRAGEHQQVAARDEPDAAADRRGGAKHASRHEQVAQARHPRRYAMRAWQVRELGEPREVLTLAEVPTEPGPGQVLVRVLGAAANFPDVLMIRGGYQVRPPLPFTPGVELCGEVVAACLGVTGFAPGDRVIGARAGVAAIICGSRFVFAYQNHYLGGVMLLAVLAGSVLGFLVFNYKPARIFMGDCGSMFIGFSLGSLAIASPAPNTRIFLSTLLYPTLAFLYPIFDTLLVSVLRRSAGRPISVGGRDHSSHRLVSLGLTEQKAVWVLWLLAAIGASAGRSTHAMPIGVFAIAVLLVSGVTVFGIFLATLPTYAMPNTAPVRANWIRKLTPNLRAGVTLIVDTLLAETALLVAFLFRWDNSILAHQCTSSYSRCLL